MGVLGAFVFAAQMVNFSIPGTGSSGHIGGGVLLAALLGPCAGVLVLASVLVIQALFFADGGLLALGANVFNLGVIPCLIVTPLLYRPLAGNRQRRWRIMLASLATAICSLQLGSLGVVLETVASGISELPLRSFLLVMQPIHLAIGVVEGVATAGVILYVANAHPELVRQGPLRRFRARRLIGLLALVSVLVAGVLSWLASDHPDGLEWSIASVSGSAELDEQQTPMHQRLAQLQRHTAVLPEYTTPSLGNATTQSEDSQAWSWADPSTSIAGFVGGILTLVLVLTLTAVLRLVPRRAVLGSGQGDA